MPMAECRADSNTIRSSGFVSVSCGWQSE